MLGSCRITELAPRRHAAAFTDPTLRIDACGDTKLACALLVWIVPAHHFTIR